jgi:thioredoxin-related protein
VGVALLLAVCNYSCVGDTVDDKAVTSSQHAEQRQGRTRVQWLDFNDGLVKAQTENKPVFLHFYTEWCIFCKKLDRETLQNQAVAGILEKDFVAIRVNAEKTGTRLRYHGETFSNPELSRYFGVNAFPSLAFLDASGQPVTLIPGFIPATEFLALLNYILQKCYLTDMSLEDFAMKGNCD